MTLSPRLLQIVAAAFLAFEPAAAAPPAPGSEDADLMAEFSDWIKAQRTPAGAWCCDVSDGRPLFEGEWRVAGGRYQVFIGKRHWPDAPDRWIDVPQDRVINQSPIGLPVAWWAYGNLYCFAPVGGS